MATCESKCKQLSRKVPATMETMHVLRDKERWKRAGHATRQKLHCRGRAWLGRPRAARLSACSNIIHAPLPCGLMLPHQRHISRRAQLRALPHMRVQVLTTRSSPMQAQELHGGRVACMPVHLLLDPGCTFCQPLPVPC